MRKGFFAVALLVLTACASVKFKDSEIGVLVLAHGASQEWNQAVANAVEKAEGNFPREIAFGMGDALVIQKHVNNLEKLGVKAIVVIPLFVSSASEMYRNIEYVLRIRDEPDVLFWLLVAGGENEHSSPDHITEITEQVKFSIPHIVTSTLEYHPLIAAILEERLRETGHIRSNTTVFLIAHGPILEDDNKLWLRNLNRYALSLSERINGISISAFTLRDDAPHFLRDRAVRMIREAALRESAAGKTVVVLPYLLAPGGREMELRKIFNDCASCVIHSKPLLPHKNISRWIEEKIQEGIKTIKIDARPLP